MTTKNPYETLGVTKEASFEDIQQAKVRLSGQLGDDRQKVETIEAAYDAIIMDRLKMRQEGKLNVPEGIRFPEREAPPTPSKASNGGDAQSLWLKQWLDNPDRREVLIPTAALGGLGIFTLFVSTASGTAFPTLLTLGCVFTTYWLTRKEKRFGRSLLLTLGGLVVGMVLAIAIVNLGAIPVANGGFSSGQLATFTSLLTLWLASTFLR